MSSVNSLALQSSNTCRRYKSNGKQCTLFSDCFLSDLGLQFLLKLICLCLLVSICSLKIYILQVVYLRQFKELRTLNLSGNPFCSQADYKPYVIAFLSSVNFLDYRLIDEQSVSIPTQLGCNYIY